MFSQLGPLFKTTLRQAESADTRLEIRRDEKQDQGKKQDSAPDDGEPSALWEDSTTVSVEALQTFLLEFLKSRGAQTASRRTGVPDNETLLAGLTPEIREPANTIAARAVKAYAAHAAPVSYTPMTEPEPAIPESDMDLADLLKADEVRTMHQLVAELDQLARKGVQFLTIERAETFLESLVQAVRLEKARV